MAGSSEALGVVATDHGSPPRALLSSSSQVRLWHTDVAVKIELEE